MKRITKVDVMSRAYDYQETLINDVIVSFNLEGVNLSDQELDLISETISGIFPTEPEGLNLLNDIAVVHGNKTLARTRVFNERRLAKFRNECFNEYMSARKNVSMRSAMNEITENFRPYEKVIKEVFNAKELAYANR